MFFSFGTCNLQLENKKRLNFLVENAFTFCFFAKGRFSVKYLSLFGRVEILIVSLYIFLEDIFSLFLGFIKDYSWSGAYTCP